jgi:hypothetical protein
MSLQEQCKQTHLYNDAPPKTWVAVANMQVRFYTAYIFACKSAMYVLQCVYDLPSNLQMENGGYVKKIDAADGTVEYTKEQMIKHLRRLGAKCPHDATEQDLTHALTGTWAKLHVLV